MAEAAAAFDPARAPGIAGTLAGFAHDLADDAIPAEVRDRAAHLILDAVGIALASSRRDFAKAALSGLDALGDRGEVAVIGMGRRRSARDAAVLNGILCHGLDFDDTHLAGIVHGTACCFPAAWSAALLTGATGRELLTAYVVGIETASRLGAVARGAFHQVGFHPTSVCGAFGAALAAGRLFGLDEHQLHMAQGIVLSQAAGSFEFLEDGAWTKRFHPGWAAASGLTAAALAKGGYIGASAVYEGRFGLFRSHLGPLVERCDLDLATAGLGEVFEVMNVAVKPYPACHFTHGCLDAASALHGEGLDPAAIRGVTALVPADVVSTVCEPLPNKRRPRNAYDAQFSIPYQVAATLLRGRFTLDELDDASLADPAILELAARIGYAADPATTFPKHYTGELIVELAEGRSRRHRVPVNRGAPDRPLANDEIGQKFMTTATQALSPADAEDLAAALTALDRTAGLEPLARRLAGPLAGI